MNTCSRVHVYIRKMAEIEKKALNAWKHGALLPFPHNFFRCNRVRCISPYSVVLFRLSFGGGGAWPSLRFNKPLPPPFLLRINEGSITVATVAVATTPKPITPKVKFQSSKANTIKK